MEDLRKNKVICVCLSHNHYSYIKDALDGFVSQKVDFSFQVYVIDDRSDDGTVDVIKEYELLYPEIIKGIYHSENYFSKGEFIHEYLFHLHKYAKYVSLCEGDDYWTDPLKLQKQVDFLETHSDYSMCFHNAVEHWENASKEDRIFSNVEGREYSGLEIYTNWIIPTASILYRAKILLKEEARTIFQNKNFVFFDVVLFLYCATQGKLYGMRDVMSVYRRTESSLTMTHSKIMSQSIELNRRLCNHHNAIYKCYGRYFGNKLKLICKYNYFVHNYNCAWISIDQNHVISFLRYFSISCTISLRQTIKRYKQLFKWLLCKMFKRYFNVDLVAIKRKICN